MADIALKITTGIDKMSPAVTHSAEGFGMYTPGAEGSTLPRSANIVEFEIPNELTRKTISNAETGVDVVVCADEEDFFRRLDE
ncbi:MAG: hypothetical protein JXA57_18810 [Armatimonadetes bacterium]|nr:hypothetical protein [Armatimonadota bacterium]